MVTNEQLIDLMKEIQSILSRPDYTRSRKLKIDKILEKTNRL